ncbi:MAG: acyl carrier protein [Prevotellaceae bacterium]|jgi:acyl carrier protein|nr:acyl carrier protein [Prevotellaceae bacterium]
MDRTELTNKVNEASGEEFEVDASKFVPDANINDTLDTDTLDTDSLDVADVFALVENLYDYINKNIN